jgi:serine/threonine protein kinase/CheY-like chemotaxis protein
MTESPPRIAIIDDEPVIRNMVMTVLSGRGWSLEAYTTFAEAASTLAPNPPDLMIVDVGLPDGCGLNLMSVVLGKNGTPIPTIVISGASDESDVMRGFAAGAVDWLSKPFRSQELLARCRVQLARLTESERSPVTPDIPFYGGLAFGRYKIVRELGRGAYGVVHLAKDGEEGPLVALKVCSPNTDDSQTKSRFIRESFALKEVSSPFVVKVLDVGSAKDRLYYAMEYVPGSTISATVLKSGSMSERETRKIAKGLLETAVALEAAGIIHRDIKPSNVILRNDDVSSPVLIDFGLAKHGRDRRLTSASGDFMLGTPSYIAPEVIRGADPGHQSDLWAIGMTIRWCLMGEDVFPELSGYELLKAVETRPISLPATGLSGGFLGFMTRMLERDAGKRHGTASEALTGLEAVCKAEEPLDRRRKRRKPSARRTTRRDPPTKGTDVLPPFAPEDLRPDSGDAPRTSLAARRKPSHAVFRNLLSASIMRMAVIFSGPAHSKNAMMSLRSTLPARFHAAIDSRMKALVLCLCAVLMPRGSLFRSSFFVMLMQAALPGGERKVAPVPAIES